VSEIVVVEGAHPLDPGTFPRLEVSIRVVTCSGWAAGPGASLRAGLAVLAEEAAAAVVVLADGPHLAAAAVERVLDAWRVGGVPVVAASYDGARSHPLILARSAWADVPDEGLRRYAVELVDCSDLGSPGDVDTPDDLDRSRLRGTNRS
jgi:CTP:molybdopterin cytidylyltransferase MocA